MSASGYSYKAIAKKLNAEGIAPPRPRRGVALSTWAPTAIREMLRRELYIGKVVWNRSKFVKVPGKNKRVARPRPKSDWIVRDRPELRIVSDELWASVHVRLERMMKLYPGPRKGLLRRSASGSYLLSGLLKCGTCGANLTILTGHYRRQSVYGCPQHFVRGACSNDVRVRRSIVEAELFSGLQKAITQPAAVEYILSQVQTRLTGMKERNSEKDQSALRKQLEAELNHLTAAIAESGHSRTLLKAIEKREEALAAIETGPANPLLSDHTAQELRKFVMERLQSIPTLLHGDVPEHAQS